MMRIWEKTISSPSLSRADAWVGSSSKGSKNHLGLHLTESVRHKHMHMFNKTFMPSPLADWYFSFVTQDSYIKSSQKRQRFLTHINQGSWQTDTKHSVAAQCLQINIRKGHPNTGRQPPPSLFLYPLPFLPLAPLSPEGGPSLSQSLF